MSVEAVRGDITGFRVGAVVNAANRTLLGGGGVDGAIHRAAGPELLEYCRDLPLISPGVRCETGRSVITPAFDLRCDRIIHTVGPVWQGGESGEDALLAGCYRSALELAAGNGIVSVAFPAISCGAYGFPVERACRIAIEESFSFSRDNTDPSRIIHVAYGEEVFRALKEALARYRELS